MFKKHIGAALVALGVLLSIGSVAAPVQAASLTSTQVQAVISLLQSFGVDANTIASVNATLGGTPATPQSCVDLGRNLTISAVDDSTGDVTRLQNYLNNKGYLSISATGYYGFLTAQAVGKLQLDLGIVSSQSDSAYGFMGPKTRAAIACVGSTNTTSSNATQTNTPTTPPNSSTSNAVQQAPTISYIGPSSTTVGTTVYVYGTNFDQYTFVALDGSYGQSITPTINSATALSFVIPSNTSIGNHTVQVNEKGGSFPLSNAVSLSVVATSQPPTITSINPTSAMAGVSVSVYGTNFDQYTFVALDGSNGQSITPTPVSSQQLNFVIPSNTTAGTHTVQVNEKGGSFPLSNAASLVVSVPAPSLSITNPKPVSGQTIGFTRNTYTPIQWTTANIDATVPLYIELDGPSGTAYRVAQNVQDNGSYSLYVNADINGNVLPDGTYSIKVCTQTTSICDIQGPILVSSKG